MLGAYPCRRKWPIAGVSFLHGLSLEIAIFVARSVLKGSFSMCWLRDQRVLVFGVSFSVSSLELQAQFPVRMVGFVASGGYCRQAPGSRQ